MKKLFSRIEFWILFFLLIRFIGITNPPLEIGHNWRQVTGLMVSRNFLEVDANILYPRVDDNNGQTGIIGMEFPSMNYIYFLTSKMFGHAHWYGRMINLIISSLGLLFFYKIVCLVGFRERIAFLATILLTTSIWFTFSRKMMPDTYCISLIFIGLYYGIKYLNDRKIYQLVIYTIICSLAVLSKIPAGIYFVLLIPFLFNKKYTLKSKISLSIGTFLALFLTYIWYFEWNTKLSIDHGNWYNLGKPIEFGFYEIINNIGKTLKNFYFYSFSSYIIFFIFSIGLLALFIQKERKLLIAFFLLFAVFLVYMFKSGFFFFHHNYYIIPFVPMMSLVAGYALSLIKKKWLLLTLLIVGVTESIGNHQHDFFIKDSEKYKMTLEPIMDKISQKDDLILINGNENPQMIYLSHRKGWNCNDDQLFDSTFVKNVAAKNCKYLVINKHNNINFQKLNLPFKQIFENSDFLIMQMKLLN
jgi:hypothetical protein